MGGDRRKYLGIILLKTEQVNRLVTGYEIIPSIPINTLKVNKTLEDGANGPIGS
jgi:hypothetical protein